MKTPTRKKPRPLLLAAAGAATVLLAGCKDDVHPSGNLLAPPDQAVPLDMTGDSGPSGNLLAPPRDMSEHD